jgi:hypothetical protein
LLANWNTEKYLSLTKERIDTLFKVDTTIGELERMPNTTHYWVRGRAGSKNRDGYRRITIDRKAYYLHDLIWFYHYGKWPNGVIDHIDGNKQNNSIDNLRDVSPRENGQNQYRHRQGKLSGALYHKDKNVWYSLARFHGHQYYLGSFKTEQEAHNAYNEAVSLGIDKYFSTQRLPVYKGITFHKRKKKFMVYVLTSEGKKHCGYYKTIEEAIIARDNAIDKYRTCVTISHALATIEDMV